MGAFTRAIRNLQAAFKRETEKMTVTRKDGTEKVKPHAKVRQGRPCQKCGKFHSVDEHRFHGVGSNLRTHGAEGGPVKAKMPAKKSAKGEKKLTAAQERKLNAIFNEKKGKGKK